MSGRRIILCADDYGISPGVSAAIRDLIARGRINATSVMVVAPSFSRSEADALLAAAATHGEIGLHVTLTAPFAPLSHGFAPLGRGAFLSLAVILRRALLRSLQPELLTIEILRQFEAFDAAFGRPPDFVDGHQHVHLFPQIRDAFLRATKKASPKAWVRQCGRLSARKRLTDHKALLLDGLSRRFRGLADKSGLRINPAFAGTYSFRSSADYTRLFENFLDGMPEGGVIMCHPGKADAELSRLDTLTDLREHEYTFFSNDTFPRLLAAHGVSLAPSSTARSREIGNSGTK
jgi:predicted glycoside hydrolase/deacetylase ChbG (UPF0249 family)